MIMIIMIIIIIIIYNISNKTILHREMRFPVQANVETCRALYQTACTASQSKKGHAGPGNLPSPCNKATNNNKHNQLQQTNYKKQSPNP